jgi:hypothetical protein
MDMAVYGFVVPDTRDELTIVASMDAIFDGTIYPAPKKDKCPRHLSIKNYPIPRHKQMCFRSLYEAARMSLGYDPSGYFRITKDDIVTLYPSEILTPKHSLQFQWILKQLKQLNVTVDGIQYILYLNVMEMTEPHMNHATSAWMAISALPEFSPLSLMNILIHELSQCKRENTASQYYYEDYPIDSRVRNLAKLSMLKLCTIYEESVLKSYTENFKIWIAARNARLLKTLVSHKLRRDLLPESLHSMSSRSFYSMLKQIVDTKRVVYSDKGSAIDSLTAEFMDMSRKVVERTESIYKLKMQISYLFAQRCRLPLEAVTSHRSFRTLVDKKVGRSN